MVPERSIRRSACASFKGSTASKRGGCHSTLTTGFGIMQTDASPVQLWQEFVSLARDGQLMLHRSPGCKACDNTGFKGRAGLHELMMTSRALRHLVQTGARAEALQTQAMSEGMRTLRQDGIEKVLAGVTTIEEVRATSNA